MNTDLRRYSPGFTQLYCDAAVYSSFSTLHPISFARVLPFHAGEPVVDDHHLVHAEEAHLAERDDDTRRSVVEAYCKCGLLPKEDASHVMSVIDFFDTDFFELMGLVYANAGMFRCALRWYREQVNELETRHPNASSDTEGVYASVGYGLYSLGLFEEAIAWSKSCIGPRQTADAVCRALIDYEAQLAGGAIRAVERSGPRTKYTVRSFAPPQDPQSPARLKAAMRAFAPFQDVYLDWFVHETPSGNTQPPVYPFSAELDAGSLRRHRLNLIFATCGLADVLGQRGYHLEAKRLLHEVAMWEPQASIVTERLRALP